MKKRSFLFCVLFVLATNIFAQQSYDLGLAVEDAVSVISKKVPKKATVAVVYFRSDSEDFSTYLIEEIEKKMVKKQYFTVVERNPEKLALINAELEYQSAGNVSEQSMVEIGEQLGAQYIVYGKFEQFSDLELTVQTVSVESAELIVHESYLVKDSPKITNYLGESKKPETPEEYTKVLAKIDESIANIEKEIESEKDKKIASLESERDKKYSEVSNTKRKGYESDDEFSERKQSLIDKIDVQFENDKNNAVKDIENNYKNSLNQKRNSRDALLRELKETDFTLNGDSVQILIGDFNYNAKPKHWPVTVKSLDRLISYQYQGKIELNINEQESEFDAFEQERKAGNITGEIEYKLETTDGKQFNICIKTVRVFHYETGRLYKSEEIDKNIGKLGAGNQKKGSSSYTPPKKTTTKKTKAATVEKTEAPVVKETKTSKKTVETSKSSDFYDHYNPFEDITNFKAFKSDDSQMVVVEETSFDYRNEHYTGIRIAGNTNEGYNSARRGAACENNAFLLSFLQQGSTLKFKVIGDGNSHRIVLSFLDGTCFETTFTTEWNEVTEVTIPYSKFKWQSGTSYGLFDLDNLIGFYIEAVDNSYESFIDFDFTIYDVKVF